MKIAVIGAGMGGLTAALALARSGQDVTLYERSAVLGELGAGITLAPNAVRVLDWLGVDVRPIGVMPRVQWTQHWQTGKVLKESDRGADFAARHGGAGYYHVHRADLHTALASAFEAAAPGRLVLGHALSDVTPEGRMRFENGAAAEADIVVGADGVRSGVRAALWPADAPEYTGQVAWRGLVPLDALPAEQQGLPPGIHIGPGRLFMRYPVRGGAIINFAAFVETAGWQEEGWTIPSTIPELMAHFEDWDPLVRTLISATPPDKLFKWALHARAPLETWTRGRVTLLGDAAHAMLPFMGQGAAAALEDAAILARCLAHYAPDEALARYEANRQPIANLIQTQSRLLGMKLQGKDPDSLHAGPLLNEESMGLFERNTVVEAV
ncbi:MAG: FAD-dependent monooxygenase [Polymorphobacter sp.]|uniref:FAD-dependent monooxygenase n=1 Tax=Polymorphobacter sp. TaxID=1909290 RepID=UPI003A84E975